jgi:hypothetical protein
MLKCVPLDVAWTGSETKLDLKAIYRRRKQDNWGNPILDANGQEQWDTTGPLPLRRHNAWERKGFRYITLADYESLQEVAPWLNQAGLNPRDFIQDMRTRSPFSLEKYQAGLAQELADELSDLRELVAEYGLDAVTGIKKKENPAFVMPAKLVEEFSKSPEPPKAKKAAA